MIRRKKYNMNCDTCSHFSVCKYKDKINKKMKELGFDGNDLVFELNIKCRYYDKYNPMEDIKNGKGLRCI